VLRNGPWDMLVYSFGDDGGEDDADGEDIGE
jgi:hypothetical protein